MELTVNVNGIEMTPEGTPFEIAEFVKFITNSNNSVDAKDRPEFEMDEEDSNLPLWKRVYRYSESKGQALYISEMDINHVVNALAKDIRKQKFEGIDKSDVGIRAMVERLAYELNS